MSESKMGSISLSRAWMSCVGELRRMIIIYRANVWGSQHNVACGKHTNETMIILNSKIVVAGAGGTIFHPSEKKATSPGRLQLAKGKQLYKTLFSSLKWGTGSFHSPQYLKHGWHSVNVYSHFKNILVMVIFFCSCIPLFKAFWNIIQIILP